MKLLNLVLLFIIAGCATKTIAPIKDGPIITSPIEEVFSFKSSLPWVEQLSNKANCVLDNKDFLKEVSEIEKFDYSDKAGIDVVKDLLNAKCTIRTYKTRNPFSSVLATTYSSDRENFYLNLRKNPRAIASMVNTSIHECLHLAGYSHGDNSSVGKQNTVNYKIGKIAELYASDCL